MKYIAAIDHDHLDNGMFLTGLARAVSKQKETRPIIIHAGSAYTERVMQTGVMRDEAEVRAQKDLNHRLVALFADEGVSAVGINGYQRKSITLIDKELKLKEKFFTRLPDKAALILSSLVWDEKKAMPVPVPLSRLTYFIQKRLGIDKLFVFNKNDGNLIRKNEEAGAKRWERVSDNFKDEHLPDEFQDFNKSLLLTTTRDFQSLPELKKSISIE